MRSQTYRVTLTEDERAHGEGVDDVARGGTERFPDLGHLGKEHVEERSQTVQAATEETLREHVRRVARTAQQSSCVIVAAAKLRRITQGDVPGSRARHTDSNREEPARESLQPGPSPHSYGAGASVLS